jgi:hypothetical protein
VPPRTGWNTLNFLICLPIFQLRTNNHRESGVFALRLRHINMTSPKRRLLLVDDDPLLLEPLRLLLVGRGYEVTTVGDGASACRLRPAWKSLRKSAAATAC